MNITTAIYDVIGHDTYPAITSQSDITKFIFDNIKGVYQNLLYLILILSIISIFILIFLHKRYCEKIDKNDRRLLEFIILFNFIFVILCITGLFIIQPDAVITYGFG